VELEELKEILRVLDERGISEFELEKEGIKLRIRKVRAEPAAVALSALSPQPSGVPLQVPAARPGPAPPGAPAPAAPHPAGASDEDESLTLVRSPIVGTFYRAPAPDAPPFVEVGDSVKPGQVLCIVEAMKLMNEIESEVAGKVVKRHAENAQPVQYGDPLFSIEPA
jgi:acetyl-CoA carboxylase biotin carboxyl carrier protein